MAERENERQRNAMRAALAPHVDEEVVAGQWFRPAKSMEDNWRRPFSWLRHRVARGDHPTDLIRGWNVLVLTPTRLLAFTARPVRSTPPVAVQRPIGAWPLGELGLEFKGRKAQSTFFFGGATTYGYSSKIVRATLRFEGEERPLVMDFPDDPLARELLKAVRAAIDAAR